jgi:Fur family ferric uptake transcriptional regulator
VVTSSFKALQALEAYVVKNGLKQSQQRVDILKIFFEHAGHLSVDQVTQLLHQKNLQIGAATVYRGLKVLLEAGIVDEKKFGGDKAVYEIAIDQQHHDHLICKNCGKIIEFVNEKIEELQEKVAQKHKFKITSHRLELFGLCESCQNSNR